jgi:hypothetical protein
MEASNPDDGVLRRSQSLGAAHRIKLSDEALAEQLDE